jgi:hypothetical protein
MLYYWLCVIVHKAQDSQSFTSTTHNSFISWQTLKYMVIVASRIAEITVHHKSNPSRLPQSVLTTPMHWIALKNLRVTTTLHSPISQTSKALTSGLWSLEAQWWMCTAQSKYNKMSIHQPIKESLQDATFSNKISLMVTFGICKTTNAKDSLWLKIYCSSQIYEQLIISLIPKLIPKNRGPP